MKNLFFILSSLFLITSCNDDDEKDNRTSELKGTWKLTEVYSDIGNRTGQFSVIESEKTITFNKNGKLVSNGEMCDFAITTIKPSSGTYNIKDSTITINNCNLPPASIHFSIDKSSNLIITFPCIEECKMKFQKL